MASFFFPSPAILQGDTAAMVTGMFLVDDEGVLETTNIEAQFKEGMPLHLHAKYVMKTTADWDRFMRFMGKYAEENDLGFQAPPSSSDSASSPSPRNKDEPAIHKDSSTESTAGDARVPPRDDGMASPPPSSDS
mmetsp:Transcript_40538/g.65163  ORF Transcript_40538/g.65163 Transcript_40538/m.65163 type:complete len:134 (+) Transcript_40538:852-1253(+)